MITVHHEKCSIEDHTLVLNGIKKYCNSSPDSLSTCGDGCPLFIRPENLGKYTFEGYLPANVVAIVVCGCEPVIYAGPKP